MSKLKFLDFHYNLWKKARALKMLSMRDSQVSDRFEPNKEEMKQVFNKISNNKEKLDVNDLKRLLQKFKVCHADQEARLMMEAADMNEDGFVDFGDFLEVHKGGIRIREIRSAFWTFDQDGDGRISAEELKKTMDRLGEDCSLEDCRRMVKHVDKNGDGVVDMDEFLEMMTGTMKPI